MESGAHLLTKRRQHLPVHWDFLNAPVGPIVDVGLIRPEDPVRHVCDDTAVIWLRELCCSVVYHRGQRNHESSAFICPFDRAGFLGRKNKFVPSQCQEEATALRTSERVLSLFGGGGG